MFGFLMVVSLVLQMFGFLMVVSLVLQEGRVLVFFSQATSHLISVFNILSASRIGV